MTYNNSQQEPSMEDILASIRSVLSENEESLPVSLKKATVLKLEQTCGSESVLLTTDPEEDNILELTDDMLVKKEEHIMESVSSLGSHLQSRQEQKEKELVSPLTAALSTAALDKLVYHRAARERDFTLGRGDMTLEVMVREELRPLIKAWLDEHLLTVIERIVAKEIKRLVHEVENKWQD